MRASTGATRLTSAPSTNLRRRRVEDPSGCETAGDRNAPAPPAAESVRTHRAASKRAIIAMRGPSPDPGLRDEQLLEQADGVAVGHPGQEVLRATSSPSARRSRIEELAGPLPDLLPQAAEDAGWPWRTRPWRPRSRRPRRTGSCGARASPRSTGSLIRISVSPPASVSCTTSVTIRPMRSDDECPRTTDGSAGS